MTNSMVAAYNSGTALEITKDQMAAALMESGDGSPSQDETLYLTFSGMGRNYRGYALGREREAPPEGALYVVDPKSFIEGWTCWKGGKPLGKHEWSVYNRANAVKFEELEDFGPYADGEGWKPMAGFSMFDLDNPDQRILFTTTSVAARLSVEDLRKAIGKNVMADEPHVPAIGLDSELFEVRGQVNGKPTFPVDSWMYEAEVMAFLNDTDRNADALLKGEYASVEEAAEEPAPTARRRRA